MDDDEKAKKLADKLIKLDGSQPDFRAAPRRRPPDYKNMYFDPETGDYSIDADTIHPNED